MFNNKNAGKSLGGSGTQTVGPKQRPGLFIHFVSVCYVSLGKNAQDQNMDISGDPVLTSFIDLYLCSVA